MRTLAALVFATFALVACSSETSDTRTETNGTTTVNRTDTAAESCGMKGCLGPVELKGTKSNGEACTKGAECAPVQCSCPQPGRRGWYASTCKNAVCVAGNNACENNRDFFCPE